MSQLPSYDPELSANPFVAFVSIPVDSRYRFLLDDAHFIIDGFIKGPVCHGQVALNVIEDRFWITFVRPEAASTPDDARFYAEHASHLALPAGEESNTDIALNWLKYSEKQKSYLRERAAFLNRKFGKPADVTLDLLWDGNGTNRDATLTVMRHEDSATVVRGLVGSPPKTSWVLGYGLLERIHYLLVAGFDVFGNVGHQVSTRLYMDFLRMESEMNFLSLLPRDARKTLRDEWYEDAEDVAREYIQSTDASFVGETGLKFSSMNPELELYERLQAHLRPVVDRTHFIEDDPHPRVARMAADLSRLVGNGARQFPPLSFLEVVQGPKKSTYYTLVRDDWHTNVTSLFFEKNNRRPEQDRLTVLRGFVGAYPNAFFRVKLDELEAWTQALVGMKNDVDYRRLRDRFAVRRTSADFWGFADALHADALARAPLAGGLFDFSRLENR